MSERPALLLASPLEEGLVAQIRVAAADHYDVHWRRDLYPEHFDRFAPGFPAAGPGWDAEQQGWWRETLGRAAIVFDHVWIPEPQLLGTAAPTLAWLQGSMAGMQGSPVLTALRPGVQVTTAAGVHAVPLAEHVVAALLHLRRGMPDVVAHQRARAWTPVPFQEVSGSRALVIGMGSIGTRVARVLGALDVEVLGAVRRPRNLDTAVTVVLPGELDDVLPAVDVVVLCCPLTDATRGLLSRRRIAMLGPNTVVINIGRGGLVDEDALIEALESGSIAGAVLDTVRTEPLPPASRLWALPNVLLTSHSAGVSPHEPQRLVDLFVRNLRRYTEGEELQNGMVHR